MWSVWLVFCDCGFHSVCPLMEKDKRLMDASWWERLTERETGSCSDERGVLSKSLIQFSVHGWSYVHSLLFDLRLNYGGGNKESESEVAQSCPTLCDLMDYSLPGSSVHGIFQAKILEWVAISSGDLPNPGIEPTGSPALWADVLPSR